MLISVGEFLSAGSTDRVDLGDENQRLSERLVGIVAAIRSSDLAGARTMVDELLASNDPSRVVILSGLLTATLAEMSEIGEENLLEALGPLVASAADPSDAEASPAIARAEALPTQC